MTTPNLDELIKKAAPIYVLNRSNPRGNVTVTVFRPDGSPYLITVPKTWIPICVTDQVSHETIRVSDDFRRNVQIGMLQLLPVAEAKQKLQDKDAQEELERLNMSKYSSYEGDLKEDTVKEFSDTLDQSDNVNLTVKEIMNRDITSTEKYHILRSDEDTLNPDDFKYIVLNGDGKVKNWAESKLST
jgi:hypothetical protein